MKKLLLLVLLAPFVLTSQTKKDTLFTNGIKKVSLNLSKPISVYFINGKQYATASTSTIRTIAGVGKVTFTSAGAITFTPYSASYNADWVFYVKDYKLFEYTLAVCKKPTIAIPIIRDTTPQLMFPNNLDSLSKGIITMRVIHSARDQKRFSPHGLLI